jgi:biofilm PGA synthesis N-glycosyltransferase PgaC
VRTPVNQGTKALAQNYVLEDVESELVVTIDADTTLHPEAIEKTLPFFNDEKTASVCGFVIPQRIETIWERGRYIEYLFGISMFKVAQNHIGAVMVSSGCFSVFRTEVLQKLGGFKQRTMAEDMDFTWEATIAGYHIYCAADSYCYPIDPPTGKIFVKQIKRWYASFFQNISIYKFAFRKRLRLGFVVYGSLLDAMISPIVFVICFAAMTGSIWQAFVFGVLLDLLVVAAFCLAKAIRINMVKQTILSLPAYLIIRPVNLFMFWYCLWNEWIIGNRLSSWDKGH